MHHDGNEWALEIAEAKEIVDLPLSDIEEVSDNNELIEGVARVGDELIPLLNVSEVMSA